MKVIDTPRVTPFHCGEGVLAGQGEPSRRFRWAITVFLCTATVHLSGALIAISLPTLATGKEPHVRHDGDGPPIPAGAIARFGTVRFIAEAPITALAFSPDGRHLATLGKSPRSVAVETVEIWNSENGVRSRHYSIPNSHFDNLVFGENGSSLLVTSRRGNRARVIDLTEAAIALESAHSYTTPLLAAHLLQNGLIALAGEDNTIELIPLDGSKPKTVLSGHTDRVRQAVFSRDGSRLLTAGKDDTIRLWDVIRERELCLVSSRRGGKFVRPSSDGEAFAADTRDGTIQVYASDGRAVRTVGSMSTFSGIDDLQISIDAELILVRDTAALQVWRASDNRLLFSKQDLAVSAATFSPDDRWVAYASGHQIRVCDANTGKERQEFHPNPDGIAALSFSPKGTLLLATDDHGPLYCWGVESGRVEHTLDIRHHIPHPTLDEKHYWSIDETQIKAHSLEHAKARGAAHGRRRVAKPQIMAFTQNQRVMCIGNKHALRVFEPNPLNAQTRKLELASPDRITAICISPDGRLVVSGDEAGRARVFDTSVGKLISEFDSRTPSVENRNTPPRTPITFLFFAPDGRQVIYLTQNGQCGLFGVADPHDTATGQRRPNWSIEGVARAATTKDGAYLLMLERQDPRAEPIISVWETLTNRRMAVVSPIRGRIAEGIEQLAVSPNMVHFATGHDNGLCYLWSLKTPEITQRWPRTNLSDAHWDEAWNSLAVDSLVGYEAVQLLAGLPERTIARLEKELTPLESRTPLSRTQLLFWSRAIHILERMDTNGSRKLLIRIVATCKETSIRATAEASLLRTFGESS